jgi:hypothetical protein
MSVTVTEYHRVTVSAILFFRPLEVLMLLLLPLLPAAHECANSVLSFWQSS